MKFFHLSDLHIGRQLNYYDLSELQRDILKKIIQNIEREKPDAVLISGDIYDKSVPSGEAYNLFDDFLNQLSELESPVSTMIIAGNHDSADRLNYASSFLEKHRIYVSVYPPMEEQEHLKKVVLQDADGPVNFYLLPFFKPIQIRHLFPEDSVTGYDDAVRRILGREEVNWEERNVILSHQFYIAAGRSTETCDSEQANINVGGLDSVDVSAIEAFDYGALGHIHGKQFVGKNHIRYCGTPLKYSVSEEHHHKSITVVELKEKGTPLEIREIPLEPLLDVRRQRGHLMDIIGSATPQNCHDYLSVTLTDEESQFKAKEKLEEYYDHILEIKVDNSTTKQITQWEDADQISTDPLQAFADFFKERQEGKEMNPGQVKLMQEVIEKVKERE